MPIRIGRIDNGHYQGGILNNFPQFEVIKQDVSDDPIIDVKYNKYGSYTVTGTNKAKIKCDLDFVTESQLESLKQSMLNSRRQLLFMKHPADSNQLTDYYGTTSPSSNSSILYAESNSDNLAYGGTEITTSDYKKIDDIPNYKAEFSKTNNSKKYSYFYFRILPYNLNTNIWQRLTFGMYSPFVLDGSDYSSFVIDVLNYSNNSWTRIGKQGYSLPAYTPTSLGYIDQRFMFYSSLKSCSNFFTENDDYTYDGQDRAVIIRMRNTFERIGNLTMGFGYPHLLTDGFVVCLTADQNFNFRSSFTGQGYTGSVTLQEV